MNESDLLSSDTTALDAEVPIPNGTAQDFLKAQQYPEVRINQQARVLRKKVGAEFKFLLLPSQESI